MSSAGLEEPRSLLALSPSLFPSVSYWIISVSKLQAAEPDSSSALAGVIPGLHGSAPDREGLNLFFISLADGADQRELFHICLPFAQEEPAAGSVEGKSLTQNRAVLLGRGAPQFCLSKDVALY